jgi:hypothetical protein
MAANSKSRSAKGGGAGSKGGPGWRKPQEGAAQPPRSPYFRPVIRRAPAARLAAGVGPAPGQVSLRGMEATQAIQSVDNSVRLIAGKATVVRLYLNPESFVGSTLITGELTWRRGSGGAHYLPAMNRVRIASTQPPSLDQQRVDIELSLNFRLPDTAIGAGDLELQLKRLFVPGGADVPFGAQAPLRLTFRSAPPLRIRAIGLRYKSRIDPSATVTPSALHFAYLKSYLQRAYPVAALEWSQIVVDGDQLKLPFGDSTSDLVNAQLGALRAREMSGGMDPRTHYYGIVDTENGRNFMRGSAMYNRRTKIFGSVACGPCGVPNGWTGDTDASFADWYGAHELGHTYQRRHPGFPASQPRDPDEIAFPYPEGFISTADHRFVGFDIGDHVLGLPMKALPGNIHHDVMTYADSQWLSAYTYEAIHDRLVREDTELAPPIG